MERRIRRSLHGHNHERVQDWEVKPQSARTESSGHPRHFRHDHAPSRRPACRCADATTNLLGPYVLPALRLEVSACSPTWWRRRRRAAAGRPQGTFVMERLLDRIADELGLRATRCAP